MKRLEFIILALCLIALIGGITSSQFSLPILSNLTEAFGNVSLFTDKPVYYLNDTVNITVKVLSNTTTNLTIEDPLQGIQSTWDLGSFTHPYNPGYTGNYTVYAFHSLGNLTGNSSVCFTVLQSPVENKTNETLSNETQIPENVTDSQLNSAYLSTDKLSYFLNETVRISLKAPENTTTNFTVENPLGGIYSTLKENFGGFTHLYLPEFLGDYLVFASLSLENYTRELNTSFEVVPVNESVPAVADLIQGKAEINKPVKWTRKIKVRNNDSLLHLNLTVSLPWDALNVTVDGREDKPRLLHAMGKKPQKVHIRELLEPNENREFFIGYETSAPYKTEQILESEAKYLKKIEVRSDSSVHYRNVKAFTNLEELSLYNLRLYHLVNGSRVDVTLDPRYNVSFLDSNNNSIIDQVLWNVPHLSNQTFELEADLTIINIQSYPTVGGNWTIRFKTQGKADLTITAVDGTVFDEDLEFSGIWCDNETLRLEWINNSIVLSDYYCEDTGVEISRVLTAGEHALEFRFGYDIEYAYNLAGVNTSSTNLTVWDDTDNETAYPSEQVYFYANYTNSTSRESINDTDVYCELRENSTGSWSSPVNMTFNYTSLLYEYSKSFSASGPFYFNVLCNGSALGYDVLNVSDETEIGFQCDAGTLDTTCNITTTHTLYDQAVISGSGSMIIQNGGDLTTNAGNRFTLNMSGYVTIKSGGSITGNINLTATNLTIESGGEINVNGKGYASEEGPGNGSNGGGGYGIGSGGGGYGGEGGRGADALGGSAYGSLTQPVDLGSGGGDVNTLIGGSGGGSVYINITDTLTLNGSIKANGGNGQGVAYCYGAGGGSGGAIYIKTNMFQGNNNIVANGGNAGDGTGTSCDGGGGGGGRVAIYYSTRNFTGNITAYGGWGYQYGGAGTIYLKSPTMTYGELTVNNNNNAGEITPLEEEGYILDNLTVTGYGNLELLGTSNLTLPNVTDMNISGTLTVGNDLNISNLVNLNIPGALNIGGIFYATKLGDFNLTGTLGFGQGCSIPKNISVIIRSGGVLTHKANSDTQLYTINITLKNLVIESGAEINVDGRGYAVSEGTGQGADDNKGGWPPPCGGGGGHGGKGGNGYGNTGGSIYDSLTKPIELGSGGGIVGGSGGASGGAINLNISDTLNASGLISANGESGTSQTGGGSGGSIYITTNKFEGNASLQANGGVGGGGAGGGVSAGGGAGGRIAIYTKTSLPDITIASNGGAGYNYGQMGSIYLDYPAISLSLNDTDSVVYINQSLLLYGIANIIEEIHNETLNQTNTNPITEGNVSIYINNTHQYKVPLNSTGGYTYSFNMSSLGTYDVKVMLVDCPNGSAENTSLLSVRELNFTEFNLLDSHEQSDNILNAGENYNITVKIQEYNGSDYFNVTSGSFDLVRNGTVYNLVHAGNSTWQSNESFTAPSTPGEYSFLANITGTSGNGISDSLENVNYSFHVKVVYISLSLDDYIVNPAQNVMVTGKAVLQPDITNVTNNTIHIYLDGVELLYNATTGRVEETGNETLTTDSNGNYNYILITSGLGIHTLEINLTGENGIFGENQTTFEVRELKIGNWEINDSHGETDGMVYSIEKFNVTVWLREYNGTDYFNISTGDYSIRINETGVYGNISHVSEAMWKANFTAPSYSGIYVITLNGTSGNGIDGENSTTFTIPANLNITLLNYTGEAASDTQITIYEADTPNIACQGDTDAQGEIKCGLENITGYDINISGYATDYQQKNITTPYLVILGTLKVTSINSTGDGVSNTPVPVYEMGNPNPACQGDTDAQGDILCALDNGTEYTVKTMYGVNMYNISTPNELKILNYTEQKNLQNLTITLINSTRQPAPNTQVTIYETGTSTPACKGDTNNQGIIKCGLDNSTNYDINISGYIPVTNITVPNNLILQTLKTTLIDPSGVKVPNTQISVYEMNTSILGCQGNTNSQGEILCALENTTEYAVKTLYGVNMYNISVPNELKILNYTEQKNLQNLTVIILNCSGLAYGIQITVYETGTSKVVCQGDTNINGSIKCEVDNTTNYDINVTTLPFYRENVSIPDTVIFYSTLLRVINYTGQPAPNTEVSIYTSGTSDVACYRITDAQGIAMCGLGFNIRYDVRLAYGVNMYNFSVPNDLILQNYTTQVDLKNLTITLYDSANPAFNIPITVYDSETSVIACRGYTDPQGQIKCSLDNTTNYSIRAYSEQITAGGSPLNTTAPNNITLQTLDITLLNSTGQAIVNKKISVYETGTSNLACQGDTNSQGQIKCGLENTTNYDVNVSGYAPSPMNTSTPATLTLMPLNITLLNYTGQAVPGTQISVYETGTSKVVCQEDTDAQGKMLCALDNGTEYTVKTMYGVNMYNISTPNELKILNYTEQKNLQNLTITLINSTRQPAPNTQVTIYETGTSTIACQVDTNSQGVIKCELDNSTGYDINISGYVPLITNKSIPQNIGFGILDIKILNSTGEAVQDVNISIYDTGTSNLEFKGSSDSQGEIHCIINNSGIYDMKTDYGVNLYGIDPTNNISLRQYTSSTSLGNISIKLDNTTGGVYSGGQITVYDSQGLVCRGYSSSTGKLKCELNQSKEYSIKTERGVNMYTAPTVNNVILMYYTGTTLANFTVNLIDGSGNPVVNETVTVRNASDDVTVCSGNTNSQGQLICEVNILYSYDVNSSFGVNMYNIQVPNNVTVLNYTTEVKLDNLSLILKNYSGILMANKTLTVYEAGTSKKVCGGNTSSAGKITCGLDSFKNYDVKYNGTYIHAAALIPRNLLTVEAGECTTLPCTFTVPELGEDQYAVRIPETSIRVFRCLNAECDKTSEASYFIKDSNGDGLNETVILRNPAGSYKITSTVSGALEIIKPEQNTYQRGNVEILVVVPDDTHKVSFKIINGGNSYAVNGSLGMTNDTSIPYKQTWQTGNFADGIYNITVYAYDSIGNLLASGSNTGITVDNTAPTLSDPQPDTDRDSRHFTVSVNTSEKSTCRYAYDDIEYEDMSQFGLTRVSDTHYRAKVSVDEEGDYKIYFACKDLTGNIGTTNTIQFEVLTEQVSGPTMSIGGVEEDYERGSTITAFVSLLSSIKEPVDATTYCNISIRHWNGTAMEYDIQDVQMNWSKTGWYYYNYYIDGSADLGSYSIIAEADPEGMETHTSAGFHVAEWTETIEQINQTVTNTWNRLKRIDSNVIKNENVNSWTLSTTSDISISYNITIPLKEGYTVEDYLPVRWNYWFLKQGGDWWNYSWGFRKEITVENTAENLIDYQILINLTSSNFEFTKTKTNGEDIRFIFYNNTNGKETELNHWIESWDPTGETAKIWVNVTYLENNTNTTIYMYYGNPTANSKSNGTKTFEFFDDFESGGLGKWTQDAGDGNISIESTNPLYGSYSARVSQPVNNNDWVWMYENQSRGNISATVNVYIDEAIDTGSANIMARSNGSRDGDYLDEGYLFHISSRDDVVGIIEVNGGTTTLDSTPQTIEVDTEYKMEFRLYGSSFEGYLNDVKMNNATDSTYSSSKTGLLVVEAEIIFDNFRIRKYTPNEPTATVGGEEVSDQTCVDQNMESRGISPYCNPLVAQSLGKGNSSLVVNVTLRPSLPVGNYTIIRELEIDPNWVWISYGQGPLGVVNVVEDNKKAMSSVKSVEKQAYSKSVGAVTTTKIIEKPIVTGKVVAVEKENNFPWTLIISLALIISLVLATVAGREFKSRAGKERVKEKKWYER